MKPPEEPIASLFLSHRRMLFLFCLILSAVASATLQQESAPTPVVMFTKEFPNSQPDYFSVAVDEQGGVVYRTAPDDEDPLKFRLSPAVTERIFSLAGKLDHFRQGNFESNRRVASMGTKTLAYENGPERHQATFNHTEVPEAMELAGLFEKLSQTQQHWLRLNYLIRFDRLGVVKELLRLEANLDQGRLLEPTLLLPVLETIQRNRSLMQLAQSRAGQIVEKLKSGKD